MIAPHNPRDTAREWPDAPLPPAPRPAVDSTPAWLRTPGVSPDWYSPTELELSSETDLQPAPRHPEAIPATRRFGQMVARAFVGRRKWIVGAALILVALVGAIGWSIRKANDHAAAVARQLAVDLAEERELRQAEAEYRQAVLRIAAEDAERERKRAAIEAIVEDVISSRVATFFRKGHPDDPSNPEWYCEKEGDAWIVRGFAIASGKSRRFRCEVDAETGGLRALTIDGRLITLPTNRR